jgi:hypothetical protein
MNIKFRSRRPEARRQRQRVGPIHPRRAVRMKRIDVMGSGEARDERAARVSRVSRVSQCLAGKRDVSRLFSGSQAGRRRSQDLQCEQKFDSLAPVRSALAGLWLRHIPFAASPAAQVENHENHIIHMLHRIGPDFRSFSVKSEARSMLNGQPKHIFDGYGQL